MVVAGTRPEIVKMAPLVRAFGENQVPFIFVHCGQHYDYNMSEQFIHDLELPTPDHRLKIRAYSQGSQTAKMLVQMERLVRADRPTAVLVEGDTNGVLATALASVKIGIPIGHVEAGLRSFDLRMSEEHNRRLTDHISTYLFAPTKRAKNTLENEHVWGKTYVTGNTVIDAVSQHLPIARRKSRISDQIRFSEFALATAHRAENVDDLSVLKNFVEALSASPIPVVFPMHPRTRKQLMENALFEEFETRRNVQILPPVGYLDFLVLMEKCELIITDSGGIQEEATAPEIRKPVLVTRRSTERPEAVEAGFAQVVGTEKEDILQNIRRTVEHPVELPRFSPYGEGNAAEKIMAILKRELSF